MPDIAVVVTGGVDTHKDFHVAAVVDQTGRVLGTRTFHANSHGYKELASWINSHGVPNRVGVEGTGSYGAGLSRHLNESDIAVVEVNRPNRQMRRMKGKTDTVDAIAATRSALNGEATAVPKSHSGVVGSIRAIRVAFCSLRDARSRIANQIQDLVVTAPEKLREQLECLELEAMANKCAGFRTGNLADPMQGTKAGLRALCRQYCDLGDEIEALRTTLDGLVADHNLALASAKGIGADVASILLTVAGDNPERLKNESSFAALCGVSPIEASSGKVRRHRLNRGGDRQANHALWRIVMVRMTCDPATKEYVARRTAEGKSSKEIIRCLKRYVAREVFKLLTDPPKVLSGSDLRAKRNAVGISLESAAAAFGKYPTYMSRIERGLIRSTEFATKYDTWLNAQMAA